MATDSVDSIIPDGHLLMSREKYLQSVSAAMEIGYILCEQGLNIQLARDEFMKEILKDLKPKG